MSTTEESSSVKVQPQPLCISSSTSSIGSGPTPPPLSLPQQMPQNQGGVTNAMLFGGGSTEPATPTSLFSDYSESGDFLSPTGLANSGKKFWNESSSWFSSRVTSHPSQSSSSGYSSCEKGNCKFLFALVIFLPILGYIYACQINMYTSSTIHTYFHCVTVTFVSILMLSY